jgi:hypothetical protein
MTTSIPCHYYSFALPLASPGVRSQILGRGLVRESPSRKVGYTSVQYHAVAWRMEFLWVSCTSLLAMISMECQDSNERAERRLLKSDARCKMSEH